MYNLNDNSLLWLLLVILEQIALKMPRKNGRFRLCGIE
jgi:hypothetical protein